jgi:hypothetical protein
MSETTSWKVHQSSSSRRAYIEIGGGNVATVERMVWADDECRSNDQEWQSIVNLISAAPELLSALKYMVKNAESEGWSGLMLSDAVAAIAKAEGKANV